MNGKITISTGCATLLSIAPLATLFRTYSWLFYAALAVAAVTAAALAVRSLRWPVWVQMAGMLGALAVLSTWMFGGETGLVGTVPTLDTLRRFAALVGSAGGDAQRLAAPVPDTDGLMFTILVTVGLTAALVQLLVVNLGQPAVAGLPMLAVYSVPVAVMTEHVSWVPFTLGAAGFMWLLVADRVEQTRRWGRRFAGDGRDVDAWEGSPLAAAGRRLGLIGVAVAVLAPMAAPPMTADALERLFIGSGYGGGPGSADGHSVNPIAALQGDLNRRKNLTLLKIRTDDPDPGYLRLAVADEITERGAAPSDLERNRTLSDLPEINARGRSSAHTSRIQVLDLRQGYLPAYLNTTDVNTSEPDRWSYDESSSVFWSQSRTERDMRYRLSYLKYDYTGSELRDAPDLAPSHPVVGRHTQVPSNQTVQALADKLTAKAENQYDAVMAILTHFSRENGFRYSTTVDEGTSGSAVVDFLQNKRGFCQQYAVTMTWLLRAARIPARVAIGFTQGVKTDKGYTVRSWDAHAWVEAYFSGFGWVPFDPTPSTEVANAIDLPWAPNPYAPPDVDPGDTTAPTETSSPEPTSNRPDRRDPGQEVFAGGGGGAQQKAPQWPYGLVACAVVLALLLLPASHRIRVRRRRLRAGGDDTAGRAWDELIDTMVDLDLGHRESDTPRAVARRLTVLRPPPIESAVAEVRLLARAKERAEYSPNPLPDEGVGRACRVVCAELRRAVSRTTRLQAALFPPSVVRAWQAHVSGAIEEQTIRWQQVKEAVAGWFAKRRRTSG